MSSLAHESRVVHVWFMRHSSLDRLFIPRSVVLSSCRPVVRAEVHEKDLATARCSVVGAFLSRKTLLGKRVPFCLARDSKTAHVRINRAHACGPNFKSSRVNAPRVRCAHNLDHDFSLDSSPRRLTTCTHRSFSAGDAQTKAKMVGAGPQCMWAAHGQQNVRCAQSRCGVWQ